MWNTDEMWLCKKNECELDFFGKGTNHHFFVNISWTLGISSIFSPSHLISSLWYPIGHPRIDRLVNTKHDAINFVLHVLCIGRKKTWNFAKANPPQLAKAQICCSRDQRGLQIDPSELLSKRATGHGTIWPERVWPACANKKGRTKAERRKDTFFFPPFFGFNSQRSQ